MVANVKFPEFREEDRRDMLQFVTEFNRVASQTAGGGMLNTQEWINMMLNACGRTTTAGRALRVLQRTELYQNAENTRNYDYCQAMILTELEKLQRSDFVRKTDARTKFDKLTYVPGQDIYDYHTSWDDTVQDMKDNRCLPDEETLIYDYKRKMDAAAVLHVQRVDKPVTIDEWKARVEEYFDTAQGIQGGPGRVLGAVGATARRVGAEEEAPPVEEEMAYQARVQAPSECPKCKGKHEEKYCVQYYADKDDTFDRAAFVKGGKRCGQCGGEHPARYHAFAKLYRKLHAIKNFAKGKEGVRTRAMGESGANACHLFAMSGKCKYGDKCKFSHDTATCEAWKNSNPSVTLREVLEEEGVDENMNEMIPPELEGLDGEEVAAPGVGAAPPDVPQMFPPPDDVVSRPQREVESVVNRKVRQQTEVAPVDTKHLPLPPLTAPLKKGLHAEFSARLSGLDGKVGVTADSGAQVPAISLNCASRAWRGQEAKVKALEDLKAARAFTGCERMLTPQKFFGFKGPAGGVTEVDVVGALRVRLDGEHADTGEPMSVEVEVPQVRVCPDQEDDFLAANPVLLDWGWEPGRDCIVFHALGKIKVWLTAPILPWSEGGVVFKQVDPPRERVTGDGECALREVKAEAEGTPPSEPPTSERAALVASESWTLDAFEERMIKVNRVRAADAAEEPIGEDWWIRGGESVACGPVGSDQQEVYAKVVAGVFPREVRVGEVLGSIGPPETEEEQIQLAAFNAATAVSKQAAADLFGKSRIDEYSDGWLGPAEYGVVLAMLECAPGGATIEKDHLLGVRIHQKARNRVYTPSNEGVGAVCGDASMRISMKHFPDGDRKVEWDFCPRTPGKTMTDRGWVGYTLFVKKAPRV